MLGGSQKDGHILVKYQPGYMPIYSLVLKLFKELTLAYYCGFQKYENVKEPLILCQFFHGQCWFFEISEISGTNGSLILKTLQRTRTSGSLILEYSKNHTTLGKSGVGLVYPFQYMIYHLSKGIQASKISHKGKGNIKSLQKYQPTE